jgi:hypothetical protein
MAGNVLADHGYKGDPWVVFEGCTTREEIYDLQTQEMEKMGFN